MVPALVVVVSTTAAAVDPAVDNVDSAVDSAMGFVVLTLDSALDTVDWALDFMDLALDKPISFSLQEPTLPTYSLGGNIHFPAKLLMLGAWMYEAFSFSPIILPLCRYYNQCRVHWFCTGCKLVLLWL